MYLYFFYCQHIISLGSLYFEGGDPLVVIKKFDGAGTVIIYGDKSIKKWLLIFIIFNIIRATLFLSFYFT